MNKTKHIVLSILIGGVCLIASTDSSDAQVAEAKAASTAVKAAPIAGKMLKDVSAIPISLGNMFRLPLGVVEVVASPLPGVTILDGLTNIGKGLKAPFDLVINTLALPGRITGSIADLAKLSDATAN